MNLKDTETAFGGLTDSQLLRRISLFQLLNNRWMNAMGTKAAEWAFRLGLPMDLAIRKTVFPVFCGGETLQESLETIQNLQSYGVKINLDYAVEARQKEEDFDSTVREILKVFDFAKKHSNLSLAALKVTGLARMELLKKPIADQTKQESEEWQRVTHRLQTLCEQAVETGIGLFIDAEETWIQPRIDELALQAMRQYNQTHPYIYTTLQMYRRDGIELFNGLCETARSEGFVPGIKFVRGAYIEKENETAQREGRPSPMQPDKASTDRDYDAIIDLCAQRKGPMGVCFATHNEASVAKAANMIQAQAPDPTRHYSFAQLYGMGDHLTYNLANAGFEVSKYLPYGPIREVIPYLIRRAEENSSITGQVSRELELLKSEAARRGL